MIQQEEVLRNLGSYTAEPVSAKLDHKHPSCSIAYPTTMEHLCSKSKHVIRIVHRRWNLGQKKGLHPINTFGGVWLWREFVGHRQWNYYYFRRWICTPVSFPVQSHQLCSLWFWVFWQLTFILKHGIWTKQAVSICAVLILTTIQEHYDTRSVIYACYLWWTAIVCTRKSTMIVDRSR